MMENGQKQSQHTLMATTPSPMAGKTLIVAEKPSVALSIAKVIGANKKKDGYMEGEHHLVSWCVGHLIGLSPADAYNPQYSKWNNQDLPILPKPWQFQVSPQTKKQFEILSALMNREDVAELIEATDAGREGELIFRLTYCKAGCKKPFKRLWISSMEDNAIREGMENLLPGKNYDKLYEAAFCRAKADWLVGINGTRLFTCLYGGKTLTVGRVMTPTLALLADRENELSGFKKEKFYQVVLKGEGITAVSNRFAHKPDAEKLRKSCLGSQVILRSVTSQQKKEKPPKLFDLTSLQREANQLYGYTAKQTLDCMQLLYEKKLATYPRTDSRYLTEDMAGGLPGLCQTVADTLSFLPFSGKIHKNQVINNEKVSDHHAIIPTMGIAQADLTALPTSERNLLSLIAVRLLCAVCPDDYIYSEMSAELECNGAIFTASGRAEQSSGFKELEHTFLLSQKNKDAKKKKDTENTTSLPLPKRTKGQTFIPEDVSLHEGSTSPPKRYTESSLLTAMENAGANDFAQIEDVERKGLGTPATRAGIIEKLVSSGFVERKSRQLIPTKKGMELIKLLPDSIKSAKLTAEWESRLKEVERGTLLPEQFMAGIEEQVKNLVNAYKDTTPEKNAAFSKPQREGIGKCPRCGKVVYEGKKSFFCSGYRDSPPCDFVLWKDNPYFRSKRKELTKEVAVALLSHGKIKMTKLYSEKKEVFYDATIVMEDNGGKYVNFKLEFDQKKAGKG